ncbi:MAG: MazG nucleotide pyrophosphohydrolase domain-containing protein [Planctomycetota bacterium]
MLFNLLLTVQIAEERGLFTWSDVLNAEAEKMVRRHPHVYADSAASTPEAAIDEFNRMKSLESKSSESADSNDDLGD